MNEEFIGRMKGIFDLSGKVAIVTRGRWRIGANYHLFISRLWGEGGVSQ